ncbi:MAG: hypothetical protein Kow0069_06360 [Promethearchaeota archaeon]
MDVLENKNARELIAVLQRSDRPLGVATMARRSGVPRSTAYHQVPKLLAAGLIREVRDPPNSRRRKYVVTSQGKMVDVEHAHEALAELVDYFRYLHVPENIIWNLVGLLKSRVSAFLALPQGRELYMALFFVYYNFTSTPLRMSRKTFCSFFHVKRLALNYYVDKILGGDLGIYHFEHAGEDYFFHEDDELGVLLRQRLDAFFEKERLKREMGGVTDPLPLHEFIDDLANHVVEHNYLRADLRKSFYLFLWDYVGKYCVERGLAGELLPDLPTTDEDRRVPERVEDIRGYCGRCGNWVFRDSAACERCWTQVRDVTLVTDCVKASELAEEYEYLLANASVECEHCGVKVPRDWELETCPRCGRPLERSAGPRGGPDHGDEGPHESREGRAGEKGGGDGQQATLSTSAPGGA